MAGLVPAIHVFGEDTQKDQRMRREVRGSSPRTARSLRECLLHRSVLRRPGGNSEEPIPDPIPNSAVKVLCADGTKS
jgi:hypothetical protein